MAGLVDRIRGQEAMPGGLISNQLAHFTSSPLAAPTVTFSGNLSTAAAAPQFIFTITMNREAFGDTDGTAVAKRCVMHYWFEDTSAGLLDGAEITGASATNTSGATAVGLVIPNSTVAGGYHVGKLVCSSTGVVTAGFTGTSGGSSTGILTVMLPNGTIAQSSQVALTTG